MDGKVVVTKNSKKYGQYKIENGLIKSPYQSVSIFSVLKNFCSRLLTALAILIFVISTVMCVSMTCNKIQNICPTFAGYTTLVVQGSSMNQEMISIDGQTYSSGLRPGQNVVVRIVDASTLKKGDIIAFYVSKDETEKINQLSLTEIEGKGPKSYSLTFSEFFGIRSKEITEAGQNKSTAVLHHITSVYRDEFGKLWFETQGSSNETIDDWYVSEDMIIGAYDTSNESSIVVQFIGFMSSLNGTIALILIIFVILGYGIFKDIIKNYRQVKLEKNNKK